MKKSIDEQNRLIRLREQLNKGDIGPQDVSPEDLKHLEELEASEYFEREETIESYKCDSLCIRYMNKDCITADEGGLCDRSNEYKEIGDIADALNDRLLEG